MKNDELVIMICKHLEAKNEGVNDFYIDPSFLMPKNPLPTRFKSAKMLTFFAVF